MFSVTLAFDEGDFAVVDKSIDEGDDAGGAWENGVPVVEGEVGGDDNGFLFVAPGDDLKEQVSRALVVREIADLVDAQDLWLGVVFESSIESSGRVLRSEIYEHFGGFDKQGGVSVVDRLMKDVLCDHALAQSV